MVKVAFPAVAVVLGVMVYSQGLLVESARVTELSLVCRLLAAIHPSYTISCGTAKDLHTKLSSVSRADSTNNPCEYTITPKTTATAGDATFTIPYTSSSGATLDAQVTVTISNIAYTAPTLSMAAGETLAVAAGGYATDGSFTISCADATSVSTEFTSVTRTANTCNYSCLLYTSPSPRD